MAKAAEKKPRKTPVKPRRTVAAKKTKAVTSHQRHRSVKNSQPRYSKPFPWKAFWIGFFVVFFGAIILYEWEAIVRWFTTLRTGTAALLGWGLLLLVIGIIVVVAILKRRAVADFAERTTMRYWYRWLGGIAILFTIWGALGLLDYGGVVGSAIAGGDTFGGVLRVVGLFVLGFALIVPAAFWKGLKQFFGFISEPFRSPSKLPPYATLPGRSGRRPIDLSRVPEEGPEHQQIPPSVLLRPEKSASSTSLPASTTPVKEEDKSSKIPERDLKLVAQEVWKRYGEQGTLITQGGWKLPPLDILDYTKEVEYGEVDKMARARAIEEALASYGVDGKVVQINAGPTVTQFGVEPGWDIRVKQVREKDKDGNAVTKEKETTRTRVKVERISSLANDLALALAAPSIRIEAPIPGKSLVGIEVPNTSLGMVSMRSVLETNTFQKVKTKGPLPLVLGKGAGGEPVVGDLARMPHLLIAGATGSGKTVCLNAIICCLILNNTPDEIRFIMIDPKRVELTPYNSLPHLATPVIVDIDKALSALRWLNQEMDRRYQKLATAVVRNIDAYHKKPGLEPMPYLVLVIDELADLMMAGFDEVEHIICRLAQMARAVGIHLVVATQRPSVDVITGLIKANFPSRISFAVTSQVDSRTILDMVGAEKLLGRGDMLYMPTEAAKPKRLQGCFVSDAETERLVYFWNSQQPAESDVPAFRVDEITAAMTVIGQQSHPKDSLFETALAMAEQTGTISASYLQRKLHIGYPRAARLAEEVREAISSGKTAEAEGLKDGGAEV